jgi:hypothetical protein
MRQSNHRCAARTESHARGETDCLDFEVAAGMSESEQFGGSRYYLVNGVIKYAQRLPNFS